MRTRRFSLPLLTASRHQRGMFWFRLIVFRPPLIRPPGLRPRALFQ
jgi:hypothetical protein